MLRWFAVLSPVSFELAAQTGPVGIAKVAPQMAPFAPAIGSSARSGSGEPPSPLRLSATTTSRRWSLSDASGIVRKPLRETSLLHAGPGEHHLSTGEDGDRAPESSRGLSGGACDVVTQPVSTTCSCRAGGRFSSVTGAGMSPARGDVQAPGKCSVLSAVLSRDGYV